MIQYNSIPVIAPIILLIVGIFLLYFPNKFNKSYILFNLGGWKSTKAF